jgi:FdhD protein
MESSGGPDLPDMPSPSVLQPLAEEAVVSLVLRGRRIARFMCTPRDLDELALGHLLTRGLLASREEVTLLFVCPDRGSVQVDLAGAIPEELGPERFIVSACGGGLDGQTVFEAFAGRSIEARAPMDSAGLALGMRRMFGVAELHGKTGGVHCAALLLASGELIVREDVGRHNAVDKVLGRALLDDSLGSVRALLTSGRIAFDMVYKAAMAGIGLVASRSIPTTSAYEFALAAGVELVGRTLSSHPIRYDRPATTGSP